MQESSAPRGALCGNARAYFGLCLRRSAQRRFIASAIAFRPSGLNFRSDLPAVFVAVGAAELDPAVAFLLPFGRPLPFLTAAVAPLSKLLACCSFAISASICAITSVIANLLPPLFAFTQTSTTPLQTSINVANSTNIQNHFQTLQIYRKEIPSSCQLSAVSKALSLETMQTSKRSGPMLKSAKCN